MRRCVFMGESLRWKKRDVPGTHFKIDGRVHCVNTIHAHSHDDYTSASDQPSRTFSLTERDFCFCVCFFWVLLLQEPGPHSAVRIHHLVLLKPAPGARTKQRVPSLTTTTPSAAYALRRRFRLRDSGGLFCIHASNS